MFLFSNSAGILLSYSEVNIVFSAREKLFSGKRDAGTTLKTRLDVFSHSPRIRRRFHPPVAPSLSVSRVSIHFDVASFPPCLDGLRYVRSSRRIAFDRSIDLFWKSLTTEIRFDSFPIFLSFFSFSFLFFSRYISVAVVVFRIYSFSINFPINQSRSGFSLL